MGMIEVTPSIKLDESELQFDYIRAPGPGGQNVNKVSSAVQLRFHVIRSPSLPPEVKERLARLAGRRMTDAGVLIIEAHAYRTQEQNRADAIRRLVALIRKASQVPRVRKPTHPSGAGRAREKAHRSRIKAMRRLDLHDWEE